VLDWFLECLLQDIPIDYFADEVDVFHNFLMVLLDLLLLLVVLLHCQVVSLLGFANLIWLLIIVLNRWLNRSQGLWMFRLLYSLIESVRPLVLEFILIKIVLNLHLDFFILLEVVEDLFE